MRQFASIVVFVMLYALASLMADREIMGAGAPPTTPQPSRAASLGTAVPGTVLAVNQVAAD